MLPDRRGVEVNGRIRRPVLLVTGGAGFVGSHVANALASDWRVKVFDNLSSGKLANLGPDVEVQIGDIRSEEDLAAAFRQGRVHAIVHCAAQTSVARSMSDPKLDWKVNVAGTERLLRAAQEHGVRRFVFMSSGGAIYGETTSPAGEDTSPPAPRSYYGRHKYAAEQLVRAAGLPYAILRPANIYGPGQRSDVEGGVVAVFLERLLSGAPIEIHGDGGQERDFVHVSDVGEAVRRALAVEADVVWNVASGVSTSVSELLELLSSLTAREAQVVYRPRRPGDLNLSALSPKALQLSGWGPPLDLRTGLLSLLAGLDAAATQQEPALSGTDPVLA